MKQPFISFSGTKSIKTLRPWSYRFIMKKEESMRKSKSLKLKQIKPSILIEDSSWSHPTSLLGFTKIQIMRKAVPKTTEEIIKIFRWWSRNRSNSTITLTTQLISLFAKSSGSFWLGQRREKYINIYGPSIVSKNPNMLWSPSVQPVALPASNSPPISKNYT